MINQSLQVKELANNTLIEVQCSECRLTCKCYPHEEIAQDKDNQIIIVRINEQLAFCRACLQNQIKEQTQQVRFLEERFIYFKQFESSFEQQELLKHRVHKENAVNVQNQQEDIKLLKIQQDSLNQKINGLRLQTNQLKERIYSLEVQQEKFWEGINRIERRTNKVQQKSLNTKFDKANSKDTFEELSKMSILHMFLDIQVDDNLAYIQGMAIGKKNENIDISWEQVSIGLGHLLIGLNFLTIKYAYEYKKIQKINIRGSQSQVLTKDKKKVYTTIYNKDTQRMFGQLLQTLLYQTYYLSEHILQAQNIQYSQEFKIPFLINANEGKIVDIFIDPLKIDERTRWNTWTKAVRYFLINFKHIITVYAINDKYL